MHEVFYDISRLALSQAHWTPVQLLLRSGGLTGPWRRLFLIKLRKNIVGNKIMP